MYIKEYNEFINEGFFYNLTTNFGEIFDKIEQLAKKTDISVMFPELQYQKFLQTISLDDINKFIKDLQKLSDKNMKTLTEGVIMNENIFQDFLDLKFFKWLAKGKNKVILVSIIMFLKLFPDIISKYRSLDLGWFTAPISPEDVVIGKGGSGLGLIAVIIFLVTAIAFSIWNIKNRDK